MVKGASRQLGVVETVKEMGSPSSVVPDHAPVCGQEEGSGVGVGVGGE